jgi:hypothetical protein
MRCQADRWPTSALRCVMVMLLSLPMGRSSGYR